MNQPTAVAVVGLFLLACIGAYVWVGNSKLVIVPPPVPSATTTPPQAPASQRQSKPQPTAAGNTQASDGGRAMSVEGYMTLHISDFAPIKEQLGGKFHVTKVEARGGVGVVSYEDGHNAYTADFRYATDEFGTISIESFSVRKNP